MAFLLIGLSEHRPLPLGQGSPLRWLALLFGLLAWHAGAGERVIYPRHSEGRNPEPYVVELLQLALARSGGDYRLEPSAQPMPQSRAQLRLEQDDPGLQVMWAQSRDDLEETLLPIRIPIYRGLIGWRIPLVSAANKDILASARTLDDLRRLRFGQRQDWADTPILRANGLEVKTSQNYESLFRMLDAGRFEVFPPRGRSDRRRTGGRLPRRAAPGDRPARGPALPRGLLFLRFASTPGTGRGHSPGPGEGDCRR
ncbi:hypothetical protein [Pseudomonas aeruginosa]|uniref:hypothetical protein n=1 Tax=Pseudomonas aeruginosa TaxID=287 RepID=UPI0015E71947|nr:hypothetical protein [Pseudomonas aeruginosa]